MLTCFEVADYFLSQCNRESGDLISNLKLQKLVYYAQGVSLAVLDRQLFPERIEAWKHGPVVPDLYQKYKPYGDCGLPHVCIDINKYTHEELSLLSFVDEEYGQFSAWKLRYMTHSEPPWKDAYLDFGFGSGYTNETIHHDAIKTHFASVLINKPCDYSFDYDLERMKEAVNSESVTIPSGMSFEEFDKFMTSL